MNIYNFNKNQIQRNNKQRINSKKISNNNSTYKREKSNSQNKNPIRQKSPKTIDYNKIKEKYGNFIDNSTISVNSKVNKEKDIDIDIDELENLEKKNINFNWLLEEQPPSNFLADTNSDINESMKYFTFQKQKNQLPLKEIQKGNEFQKEKEKENDIEKEKIITQKNKGPINIKEKVLLLLNICRKYAEKFNKLMPTCERILNELNHYENINNKPFIEMKNTIIQYNNMIFNEGFTKIFNFKSNDTNNNIDKYEQENLLLKQKLKDLMNQNEQLGELLKKMDNKNKDLINQIKIRKEKENNNIEKINKLEDELNQKEKIINDLCLIIKKIENSNKTEFERENNKSKLINTPNFRKTEGDNFYKNTKFKNGNSESYKKNQNKHNFKINHKEFQYPNSMNVSEQNFLIKSNEKMEKYNKFDKPEKLHNEIDLLDQEIFDLKSKLRDIME